MPTNISGRLTLIAVTLWVCLSLIFPSVPPSVFWFLRPTQPISLRPNLKPGIDMVGGTSLLYEIKAPAGVADNTLAEQVMNSLKKRVDPDGVRNLVWRPQGATRLEIQMPLTDTATQSKEVRARFVKVQEQLEETNVRQNEVVYAVQNMTGAERDKRLAELALGSTARAELFKQMASAWDLLKAAADRKDAAEQAKQQIEYDKIIDRIEETNLTVTDFTNVLELSKPEARTEKIAELKKRFADFPKRLAAMDAFEKEYATFREVRDSIDDASALKGLLRGSGVIEFHILADDIPEQQYQEMVERLHKRGSRVQGGDMYRWYEVDRSKTVIANVGQAIQELMLTSEPREITTIANRVSEGNDHAKSLVQTLAANIKNPEQVNILRKQIEDSLLLQGHRVEDYNGLKWALTYITPDKAMVQREGQPRWALERSYPIMEAGQRQVGFRFDPQGAKLFGDLTGSNINKPLAIILDDKLISAPNINSQISASGVITGGGRGGFSQGELNYMVNTLNAGALPARLTEEPISERTVGPQIGEDNLRRGLWSCVFGLGVVAVFLISYYYLSGVVAMIAVLMNMVLILGAMSALNATFTLPGIAGIVLTIGMAVDANVLIFERLREEQVRGLSLKMALRNAYDRAFSAILDGNVTTAITALALYAFGSEEVKGFGLTLLLGIVSSMFTALYVTKTIFAVLVDRLGVNKLSSLPLTFPRWDHALRPNIDWMGKAKIFYVVSAVVIFSGMALFSIRWAQGQMLDIEFASGTAVQFELKEKTDIEDLRKIIDTASKANPNALPAPSVVSVGDDDKTYEVVTPSKDAPAVKTAILEALKGKLNLTVESKFDLVGASFTDALNQAIFPIEPGTSTIGGIAPVSLRSHMGGVAIVMKNLDPPLSKDEVETRLKQQRLQPQLSGAPKYNAVAFNVEVSDGGRTAVVLASDPELPYDANDPIKLDRWTQELAVPNWALVRDAINKPADLQKVTNFDPQIAGETQNQAVVALLLSFAGIMIYIWMRFGDLRFATGAVACLLHDTLITLAAVGFAHYVANTFIGNALLIEPFRVNLNLVAAILTVMGYSLNDTVVIFDRIRENRGKFGRVDRNVINDSVNQTLSRTLLTGGTTIITIFVMYVWGGPGIHGFTFALLVGIVVGTYSSIAIASPILLVGHAKTADQQVRKSTPVGQGPQYQRA